MLRYLLTFFVFGLCYVFASGYDSTRSLLLKDKGYPHYLTKEEKAILPNYIHPLPKRSINEPPPFAIRAMAEWEDLEGILIAWDWYDEIFGQVVDHAQEEGRVYIITPDPSTIRSYLNNENIPLINLKFITGSFNTIWTRDYGPRSVYSEVDNNLNFIDWIYNRPRPLDDLIPEKFAEIYDIPLYSTITAPYDLIHSGGNFMVDGNGTAFSSKLILEENPLKTEAEIDSILNIFMGIDRYIKFDTLLYDLIHHIDMHMKLLDEETLLFGEYPEGLADGPQIEKNIQYLLDNFQTCFGNPYNIVRIPMPADENGEYPDNGGKYRTYTNALIINNTILVPTYDCESDSMALSIYRQAMPGYKIVGIDCNSMIQDYGAIHCMTMEIGALYPNRPRAHYAQLNKHFMRLNEDSLTINCRVKHYEGNDFSVMAIFNSVDGQFCDSVGLNPNNITKNNETGYIIYNGQITSINAESDFIITLKTYDHDFKQYQILDNASNFTTIGPVVIVSDTIISSDKMPNPGDKLYFRFNLINMGLSATAQNITAKLICTDSSSWLSHFIPSTYTSFLNYGDIEPGESVLNDKNQQIYFLDDCSGRTHFALDIYSNGYHFWSDTFSIKVEPATAVEKLDSKLPKVFALQQNYPNPFNPSTNIKFSLPKPVTVKIEVYNILGQKIETLLNKPLPAGYHEIEFNGQNLSSGVYLYRIEAGAWQDVKKMVLLR